MDTLPPVLQPLADPNVAFLLFVTGALLLIVELVHPNLITGILGVIALILAFIGFSSLPVNAVGLLLLMLGFVLFVSETQIVSHGLLTVAGVVAIVAGASLLYNQQPSPAEPVQVSPVVTAVVAITAGAIMGFIAAAALRTRRMRASPGTIGAPVDPGSPGVVQAPLAPLGTVFLAGETWSARTADERLVPRDTPVHLVAFDGLVAIVEPDISLGEDAPAPEPGQGGPPAASRP
jgi:membrane-bound serine protease (ClpP class)